MFIENQFCARHWVKPLPSGASQDIRKQIHVFNACDNCDKVTYEELWGGGNTIPKEDLQEGDT